jgi:hypothetical protein
MDESKRWMAWAFQKKAEDTAMKAKKASFGKPLSEARHGFRKGFFLIGIDKKLLA